MMSRKDYIKVAELVKTELKAIGNDSNCFGVLFSIVCGMADIFEDDNPNFDRLKFIDACINERNS